METAIQHQGLSKSLQLKSSTHTAVKDVDESQVIFTEKNYFGIMAMTMTAGSCWAGIVAMYVLMHGASTALLSVVAASAMMNNTGAIAQVEYKIMMRLFIGSLIVNALVLGGVLLA